MTPAQRMTVRQLQAQDFKVVFEDEEVVRVTKGGDKRVIFPNGTQKRGHHTEVRQAR